MQDADPSALPLTKRQIDQLIDAAGADWKEVEPAIFGALLERALDPRERHKLGAHYTPRAYVERLVLPTVVEPLRAEWANIQAGAYRLDQDGKRDAAIELVRGFHRRLCTVRVLDPACGSGNFLYVTLEHLKRLEGEVQQALAGLGDTQQGLELEGGTVSPEQMLGLETNPRAARIAEAVLWIGYLQWHFRTYARTPPREPLLKDAHNIQCRDAVLAWDAIEYATGPDGLPLTRWDGHTMKPHPVTGEPVPDEAARVPVERYINPRPAEWPATEFVVGNPPFIGASNMRRAFGDGYVEAPRAAVPEVPESADYVMHWWHKAATLLGAEEIARFGLITTNSLRQTFNRRVVQRHLEGKAPVSLAFAIPDHPWVDSAEGADVRIAMTVGQPGQEPGQLRRVIAERPAGGEGIDVALQVQEGLVFADLNVGADVAAAQTLAANAGISQRGFELGGAGSIVTREQAYALGLGTIPGLDRHIRAYLNGRDLAAKPRDVLVIDLFGVDADQTRQRFPEVYQWLLERVKPERDQNRDPMLRERWWLHRRLRTDLRAMLFGLDRFIATIETSRHRFFTFLDAAILPDNKLINIASGDPWLLGMLTSRVHSTWATRAGSWLGVGNDSVYVKTRCFETFPFPSAGSGRCASLIHPTAAADGRSADAVAMDCATSPSRADAGAGTIATLAEQIDAHRKRQQQLHPGLTLTNCYNVLERLRRIGAATPERPEPPLTPKERGVHDQGLISVLGQLHDELDAAVLRAYGWDDLIPVLVGRPGGTTPLPDKTTEQAAAEEELLTRLVALNAERAAEEARGLVRWLRPDYQCPSATGAETAQTGAEQPRPVDTVIESATTAKRPWPKTLPEQFQAVRDVVAAEPAAATPEQVARRFKRARTAKVAELLETLSTLGQLRQPEPGRFAA